MLQLNPPLWLETPKGVGLAHFATWDSLEHSIHWTVFLENGQIWTFENEQVRACKNVTLGRTNPEAARLTVEMMREATERLQRARVPRKGRIFIPAHRRSPLARKKKSV